MFFAHPRFVHPHAVHTFLGLHFTNTVDPATLVTLVLAIVAIVGLVFTALALKKSQAQIELGQEQLTQTQREIELSRTEVEEAHRPVVVPVADRRRLDPAGPGVTPGPAVPKIVKDDVLMIPVENIGSGPAVQLEATITHWLTESGEGSAFGPGKQRSAMIAGLGVGGLMPLELKLHGVRGVSGFWLTLTYTDVAGKGWITKARYVPDRERYEDVTFNTQAEGPYGLKEDTELIKPVPAGS